MPDKNIRVLIAVPAYNEEKNIPYLLDLLEPWKKDVFVIDDGSNDGTASCVREKGFRCFSRESNLGLTGFYATAKAYAEQNKYTHLISVDGDGQHDPGYISTFIDELQRYDFVSGDRFHDISGIPDSKIASNLFAILLFKKFLSITLPDVACGYRAMKIKVIPNDSSASQFGIIYDMLVRHALSGKPTGFVKIPAIYHAGVTMNTNISEITGLLTTVGMYHPSPELKRIIESIQYKNNFRINLFEFEFEAEYDSSGAYCFNTDIRQAKNYFNSIH